MNSTMLRGIWAEIHEKDRNFMCLVIGKTGSGKSMAACKIAQILDPTFDLSRVVFTDDGLMKLIRSQTLKPGSFIVMDEAGTSVDSKAFMSKRNRRISHLIQTFRMFRLGLLWTTPHKEFTDKDLRRLTDAFLECKEVYKGIRRTKCTFTWFRSNPKSGREWYKCPDIPDRRFPTIADPILIPHPDDGKTGSPGFESRYKDKKKKALFTLYDKDTENINKVLEKKQPVYKYQYKCKRSLCGHVGKSNREKPRCSSCNGRAVEVRNL